MWLSATKIRPCLAVLSLMKYKWEYTFFGYVVHRFVKLLLVYIFSTLSMIFFMQNVAAVLVSTAIILVVMLYEDTFVSDYWYFLVFLSSIICWCRGIVVSCSSYVQLEIYLRWIVYGHFSYFHIFIWEVTFEKYLKWKLVKILYLVFAVETKFRKKCSMNAFEQSFYLMNIVPPPHSVSVCEIGQLNSSFKKPFACWTRFALVFMFFGTLNVNRHWFFFWWRRSVV